ncbi:hypothetical protein Tco_0968949 [Tanacetum coccineum]
MELEHEIRITGLECNISLLEGVPFVNNMVIEDPEYGTLFIDVFGDERFCLKLRQLIGNHPNQEKLKSKRVKLEAVTSIGSGPLILLFISGSLGCWKVLFPTGEELASRLLGTKVEICCHKRRIILYAWLRKEKDKWMPMCEKLEKAVGGRRLIGQMNEACEDMIAFVRELRSGTGEPEPRKMAVFLEEMMEKECNEEGQLRDLEKEARTMAFEIDSFLMKLMNEHPAHRHLFK